jgi:hypothetical protein
MNIEYSKACLKCYNESPTFFHFFIFKGFEIPSKEITNTIIIQTLYIIVQYVMTYFYHYKNHGTLIHHIL